MVAYLFMECVQSKMNVQRCIAVTHAVADMHSMFGFILIFQNKTMRRFQLYAQAARLVKFNVLKPPTSSDSKIKALLTADCSSRCYMMFLLSHNCAIHTQCIYNSFIFSLMSDRNLNNKQWKILCAIHLTFTDWTQTRFPSKKRGGGGCYTSNSKYVSSIKHH